MSDVKKSIDSIVGAKIRPYFTAVGRVAHAWNQLQEALGQLFAEVVGSNHRVILAIWYSSKSDRAQHEMLRAAIVGSGDNRWRRATARGDLEWLVNKATELAQKRNEAIHAPIGMIVDEGNPKIIPSYFFGHPLAQSLQNKDLLQELDWCERWATALHNYADECRAGVRHAKRPWPRRPAQPNRPPRKKFESH